MLESPSFSLVNLTEKLQGTYTMITHSYAQCLKTNENNLKARNLGSFEYNTCNIIIAPLIYSNDI